MITISAKQYTAFEADRRKRIAQRFLSDIHKRSTTPASGDAGPHGVDDLLTDFANAERLGIRKDEDLWRFTHLRRNFAIVSDNPFFVGVIALVLQNTDWPASKRLDFVERHVFPKAGISPAPPIRGDSE
jgi:hypothetical protein